VNSDYAVDIYIDNFNTIVVSINRVISIRELVM